METEEQFDFITVVIANGRVTIPARIRKILGISDGDIIKVKIAKVVKKNTGQVYPRREDNSGEKEEVVEE